MVRRGQHDEVILFPGLNDNGFGDFAPGDVHHGSSARGGKRRWMSQRQIGNVVFLQVNFNASGDWHDVAPFYGMENSWVLEAHRKTGFENGDTLFVR
jgi:hypothetical protein